MSDQIRPSPAERRREKTRAAILEAAEHVFEKEGEEGLSIRRLAEAIDYSPAAIYKYFNSKDELVDELKEAFFAQLLEENEKLRSHTGDFNERARLCLKTYIYAAKHKSHHYAAAFSGQNDEAPGSLDSFLSAKKGQAFMILFDMVSEGQNLGILRTDFEPEIAAKSIWASCHGLASLMIHLPHFPNFVEEDSVSSQESFVDFHVDQVMRSLEIHTSAQHVKQPKTKRTS